MHAYVPQTNDPIARAGYHCGLCHQFHRLLKHSNQKHILSDDLPTQTSRLDKVRAFAELYLSVFQSLTVTGLLRLAGMSKPLRGAIVSWKRHNSLVSSSRRIWMVPIEVPAATTASVESNAVQTTPASAPFFGSDKRAGESP